MNQSHVTMYLAYGPSIRSLGAEFIHFEYSLEQSSSCRFGMLFLLWILSPSIPVSAAHEYDNLIMLSESKHTILGSSMTYWRHHSLSRNA